jgi:hypothetical protein
MKIILMLSALLIGVCGNPMALDRRQATDNITAVVNLGLTRGEPRHLEAAFIYGIPDTPDHIPDHFYTDIGFNYGRAGGMRIKLFQLLS